MEYWEIIRGMPPDGRRLRGTMTWHIVVSWIATIVIAVSIAHVVGTTFVATFLTFAHTQDLEGWKEDRDKAPGRKGER